MLTRLKASYQEGGVTALLEVHQAAAEASVTYRLTAKLVDLICRISRLLTLAEFLDRHIEASGLHNASNALLEDFHWEKQLPKEGEDILSIAPLLIYGNHPSMITPFLIAGSFNRPDLRIVAMSYVGKLVPHLAQYVLPLQASYRRTVKGRSKSGISHMIALSLMYHLDGQPDSTVARAQNQSQTRPPTIS